MKKHVVVSVCLLLVIMQGCYAPPVKPPQEIHNLLVRVDKNMYKIGEKIVITVQTTRDCYLSLWDTSTKGEVTQIFPNRFASDNLIRRGAAYRIPDQNDQFDFEITGPPGIERVRGVCTTENVNLVDPRNMQATETFPKISQSRPGEFDQKMTDKLSVMPKDQWIEATVTFQIVQ